jgi:phytanoyl-CoA hydroxylase
MLKSLIYYIKRLIHNNYVLYQNFYSLITLNVDSIKHMLSAQHYPSKFGGMWTDRDDYDEIKLKKQKAGRISKGQETMLEHWRDQGYIIIKQAIDDESIDLYLSELEQLKAKERSPLLVTATTLSIPRPFSAEVVDSQTSVRVVDDYFYSQASRNILMNKRIMDFIELVFESRPMLNQSLNFEKGSQQEVHQDTAFVRMNSPMKLAAMWVALEDVQAGNGELVYYPGSHRWEGFLFSKRFKHYDEERDGPEQLDQWHQWIHEEAESRGCQLSTFLPQKGDVLIWHAGLAHGGAKVTRPEATRRSLVGHYCPEQVRPLYHYYKPGQRKRYPCGDYSYCSSYYRN